MLSKMDDSVGDIVDALSEQGMLDNTIILFLSDNGAPSPPQSVYPNWGSNFPLRGVSMFNIILISLYLLLQISDVVDHSLSLLD